MYCYVLSLGGLVRVVKSALASNFQVAAGVEARSEGLAAQYFDVVLGF